MADEQLQRQQAHLRAAIANVSNEALKLNAVELDCELLLPMPQTHMLTALDAFETSTSSTISNAVVYTRQEEIDKSDALVVKLREKAVTVQKPRDALFVAVHMLLLEAGFQLLKTAGSGLVLPVDWDATSLNGLFNAEYVHSNDESIKFSLQGLFVGDKFEVYISDDKDHTHSIELSRDKFVAFSESTSPLAAASLLQNLKALRETFTPFAKSIQPPAKKETTSVVSGPGVHPPNRDGRGGYGVPSPARIPPVGQGDAFPPGLGGGNPDMLVGPDHPLFGHRGDPSVDPVPGARFDPFGPSIDPLGPSGFHRPPFRGPAPTMPFRGPAPTMPFGGPGPDHLRMPRDDDMDPNFGPSGHGSHGGGGSLHPFGSDHSFF